MAVGDVGPIHEPMSQYVELARPVLETADLRFGQCERVYSERGYLQVHSGGAHSRVKPHLASIFSECGFDVVSVASNHAMDWGEEAMLDTVAALEERGIQPVGAGRNLEEARRPAIIERNGVRIGFLAYCSVLREGYAAGPHKVGVAPLRANTYYEPREYQPGIPPKVVTVPVQEDLEAMTADIEALRPKVDSVVVSVHWGLHFIPKMIADYQVTAAKAAFAAGADLILGHHAHVPKAVGVFDGKVCFFSLSNFIMSAPEASETRRKTFEEHYGVPLDPNYPNLPYGTHAPRTLVAKASFGKGGVKQVSFLPSHIDTKLRPEVLRPGDARFDEAVRYMEWASDTMPHRFEIQGDEVVVGAP
jgi:poly-gamma-glutamate synthesis protein (capsule biosynthesis protein)